MSILATIGSWLGAVALKFVQLLAGSAAAREAGKQEATIDSLTRDNQIKDAQIEIAAKPRVDSAALDERMQRGDL